MKIYLWNKFSEGGKLLADSLGIKRVKQDGNPIFVRGVLINWGASVLPARIKYANVLNSPDAVKVASDKLQSFRAFHGKVCIPEFTESLVEASEWAKDGCEVVCRTLLRGKGGNGIIIASSEQELVKAPLYVKYVKKSDEYRVHVFKGQMFHKQRKARNRAIPDEDVNWKVRNHDNGFIFQIEDFVMPDDCEKQAVEAVKALGLDFGAVDVIFNKKENKAYVLEVNTAPGLSGTTLDKYVGVFNG